MAQASRSDPADLHSPDPRPPVWIGHVTLSTPELEKTGDFLETLGLRLLGRYDTVAIFELRGGTHLVLLSTDDAKPGPAGFDLMVDDVDATRERYGELGIPVSEMSEDGIHRSFVVTSPAGHEIQINSSHVSGRPV